MKTLFATAVVVAAAALLGGIGRAAPPSRYPLDLDVAIGKAYGAGLSGIGRSCTVWLNGGRDEYALADVTLRNGAAMSAASSSSTRPAGSTCGASTSRPPPFRQERARPSPASYDNSRRNARRVGRHSTGVRHGFGTRDGRTGERSAGRSAAEGAVGPLLRRRRLREPVALFDTTAARSPLIVPPPPFVARIAFLARRQLRLRANSGGPNHKRLYAVTFYAVKGNAVLPGGHRYTQFAYVTRTNANGRWCFRKGGSGPQAGSVRRRTHEKACGRRSRRV